jgi:response regulator RpfG family c-di-GMP phosphodiesterase
MAVLHDIGKIGISDAILLKLAALTPDERPDGQRSTSVRAWRHEPSHLTLRV